MDNKKETQEPASVECVVTRPILFSGPMVMAIREGRKTQTRRVVRPQPEEGWSILPDVSGGWCAMRTRAVSHYPVAVADIHCPYGQPGDRLWVRETFRVEGCGDPACTNCDLNGCEHAVYRADCDHECNHDKSTKWKPSIFMPRWASRITLEVKAVRVERLQEITEKDALAEGAHPGGFASRRAVPFFQQLWDTINGKKHPWASNPWVWVVSFTPTPTGPGGD